MGTDWSVIQKESLSDSASALTDLLDKYVRESFPEKTRKIKSNDKPWFDANCRRKVAKKIRIYRKEGKSARYKEARKECILAIYEAKKKFVDGVILKCKKARNSKGYYKMVGQFKTKETPTPWNLSLIHI